MTDIWKSDLQNAALRLHQYLLKTHWNGHALTGPDPGIRFNARIGRFVKGYLPNVPWQDEYTYMQAQGYWIKANLFMAEKLGMNGFAQPGFAQPAGIDIAIATGNYILKQQTPAGYWPYPNPEWKTRIATVEGCFAGIGLIELFKHTGDKSYLEGAHRWYQYVLSGIGFKKVGADGLAVNYFAQVSGFQVPNNATLLLYFLAEIAAATGDSQYLDKASQLVNFLRQAQLETGELPYSLSPISNRNNIHFLCYQYNAFEFMDLVIYYRLTKDERICPVIEKLAAYLADGLSDAGIARYDCHHDTPEVSYYTAAIAQALSQATRLGLGDYQAKSEQAFRKVLALQEADGGLKYYSRRNYGILSDKRSYPRYLAMILFHLLLEWAEDDF